jgi:hypothetical protein
MAGRVTDRAALPATGATVTVAVRPERLRVDRAEGDLADAADGRRGRRAGLDGDPRSHPPGHVSRGPDRNSASRPRMPAS